MYAIYNADPRQGKRYCGVKKKNIFISIYNKPVEGDWVESWGVNANSE